MKTYHALIVIMVIVSFTSCKTIQTVPTDTGKIIETQTDVIQGGSTVEMQTLELVREIKDPALIAKAKTLESAVIKLNADIKKANASIAEYVKASEKNAGVMFKLAIENEKLKGYLKTLFIILTCVAVLIAIKIFTSVRKLF